MQAYLQLKLSWELFKKAPDALSAPEKSRLDQVADRQTNLERRILSSLEAAVVVVPPATLQARAGEIRQRFASEEEFHNDLERIGLAPATLAEAVHRDLRVEAVLEKIASRTPKATEVDAEIFYRLHPEAFQRPEARRLRHILITFGNPAEREAARQVLEKLRHTARSAEAFAAAALRHSQCPTALDGGKLGVVKRGDLYPELEPAAFALGGNELSAVMESPVGLHLLRCDEAFAAGAMDFGLVKERIIDRLTEQRRRHAQKAWIESL